MRSGGELVQALYGFVRGHQRQTQAQPTYLPGDFPMSKCSGLLFRCILPWPHRPQVGANERGGQSHRHRDGTAWQRQSDQTRDARKRGSEKRKPHAATLQHLSLMVRAVPIPLPREADIDDLLGRLTENRIRVRRQDHWLDRSGEIQCSQPSVDWRRRLTSQRHRGRRSRMRRELAEIFRQHQTRASLRPSCFVQRRRVWRPRSQ